ncbi:MAG TPA: hypothetical protein VHJ17_13500 [Thermomonospora sp.]|nr:hypothetical protein [Thermomonospora sp.]
MPNTRRKRAIRAQMQVTGLGYQATARLMDRPAGPPVLVFCNAVVGGVGVTTTVAHLAGAMAQHGRRVAAVDAGIDADLTGVTARALAWPYGQVQRSEDGVWELPGGGSVHVVPSDQHTGHRRQRGLVAQVQAAGEGADIVLVDSGRQVDPALLATADRVLIVARLPQIPRTITPRTDAGRLIEALDEQYELHQEEMADGQWPDEDVADQDRKGRLDEREQQSRRRFLEGPGTAVTAAFTDRVPADQLQALLEYWATSTPWDTPAPPVPLAEPTRPTDPHEVAGVFPAVGVVPFPIHPRRVEVLFTMGRNFTPEHRTLIQSAMPCAMVPHVIPQRAALAGHRGKVERWREELTEVTQAAEYLLTGPGAER